MRPRTLVWIAALIVFTSSGPVYAALDGIGNSHWLNIDSTYTNFDYKESKESVLSGRLAGVRGELGLNLFGYLAVSAGGEYQDGHLNHEGTVLSGTSPLLATTRDYIRRTEFLAHMNMGPIKISGGVAQRHWYNEIPGAYRRHIQYDYMPIYVMYRAPSFYLKYSHTLWQKGSNKTHMSDIDPAAQDVEFKLDKGKGMGAEIGYVFGLGSMGTRVFAAYHIWNVEASDTQNDGVRDLTEPKNSTTEIKVGIGLGF